MCAAVLNLESPACETPRTVVLEPANYFQVGQPETGLGIYIRHDLFRALDEYAVRDTSRELSALLVGQIGAGLEGDFILVEDAIEIPASERSTGRLTTLDWQQASKVAKLKHNDKIVVGWYHTHPGTGTELTSEERELHAAFFPESWQVLYVVDPVTRDRVYYRSIEQRLVETHGFRVYGREALAQNPSIERPTSLTNTSLPEAVSDSSRERYVERTLEKLLRQTRRQAIRPVEVLLVLLLVANLVVPMLKPAPVAKVDLSPLRADQNKVGAQIKVIGSRIDKLEQHLAALQILDEQLATPAATATPAVVSTPVVKEPPGVSPTPTAAASPASTPNQEKIQEITVKSGDTLALMVEHQYGTADKKIVSAVAHYNDLKSLNIKAGQTLKFPPKEALTK